MATLTAVNHRPVRIPVSEIVRYVALAGLGILFVLPFIWMVSTSLKETGQAYRFPPEFIPQPLTIKNYESLWGGPIPFDRFYLNTVIVVIMAEIGTLTSCTFVAYSFARLKWWGREVWFVVLLATMMLPFQVVMIPVYIIFRTLGWLDTLLPLFIPTFFGNPFYIFLMRQFFMGIPRDLEDAARVDGAGSFRILWQIFVPLSKPVLLTVAMFTFVGHWNDFLGPLLYLSSVDNMTISVGLAMFQGRGGANWPALMAAATLATVPILVMFTLFQRYFVKGIVLTGMKG